MARTKQKKLTKVKSLENVFSIETQNALNEIKNYFGNAEPITLEIGCGHGDYTIELAQRHPDRNYIGLDMKGARVYVGAVNALENEITNAAFLVLYADSLTEIFPPESIDEIYIPFPDPHIRRRSEHRRLVSPRFLEIYKSILIPNGKVHLKTDNDFIYEYANKIVENEKLIVHANESDLYSADDSDPKLTEIKTKYEKHYLDEGRVIKYICFSFS